jgi:hypothetical protein
MYCSGCGLAIAPGVGFCPQCGRPLATPVPPVPGMNFLIESYGNKIRTLGVFWLVYAGISLLFGIAGLTFARAFFGSHFGMGQNGPWGHEGFPFGPWLWMAIWKFSWISMTIRLGLALAAGWGLMERAPWGRFVALVAAFLNIFHPLFGTALAIFTLVLLLGYRNNALYTQLPRRPVAL